MQKVAKIWFVCIVLTQNSSCVYIVVTVMIQKIQKNAGELHLSTENSIHIIQLWRQMNPN